MQETDKQAVETKDATYDPQKDVPPRHISSSPTHDRGNKSAGQSVNAEHALPSGTPAALRTRVLP
jgi:hypothetical protein